MDNKLQSYTKRINAPFFFAIASAIIYGLAIHSFALNNILHNHDNIIVQPSGYGTGIASGRWFLELLGKFFEIIGIHYNLPFVNGIVYILLLAATSAFLVSALQIKSKENAILIGALFVAFPTVTATMIYRFTVIFYGLSALFAVLAAWILRRYKLGLLYSSIFIALSMGIYQAYIPLTIGIFVLQLIQSGLKKEANAKLLIQRGLYSCLALILGLIFYFVGQKLSSAITHIQLTEYQGINEMGRLSLSQLPTLLSNALRSVCMLPLRDYCGIANRSLMRLAYLILAFCSILMILKIFTKHIRNLSTCIVICILCIAFLLAVGFIEVMVPNGWIYTLMVYSYCLLVCAPIAILECFPQSEHKNKQNRIQETIVRILATLLILFYGYYANVNYTAVYFAGEQINNYLSGIVWRACMTEGYTTDKNWALIGDIQDPLLNSPWENELTYSGLGFTEYLLNQYSRNGWIENYIGYNIPMANSNTIQELSLLPEVRSMPCYPNAGSIQIIDNTIIIKFQDTTY